MVRAAALLLAVLYTTVLGGLKYFGEKVDFPIGPLVQDSALTATAGNFGEELVYGAWYNSGDLREEWIFSEGGILTINGEEHTYSVRYFRGNKLIIDGEEYTLFLIRDDKGWILEDENHDSFTLYSGESRFYQSKYREMRLETECAELFSRYPDTDGWMENVYCGDIPFLADADYIDQCVNNGCEFRVKTPEQLASFCWLVNTQSDKYSQTMYLEADIDLSGYEWAPMGWSGGYHDNHAFCGYVNGGGHTIKNMTIKCSGAGSDAGFIGWETWCYVADLAFDGAKVSGGMAGVVAGQAIGGTYQNITITNSTVDGCNAGSMLGWDANTHKQNCTAEVIVNGEKFEFLSYNEYEKSKIVIEDPVEITIDENHTVTRPAVKGYTNLGWMVFYNGEQMLHRNAENEFSYTYFLNEPGVYEIYLTAFVSGQYVPISNTVSYTIE